MPPALVQKTAEFRRTPEPALERVFASQWQHRCLRISLYAVSGTTRVNLVGCSIRALNYCTLNQPMETMTQLMHPASAQKTAEFRRVPELVVEHVFASQQQRGVPVRV